MKNNFKLNEDIIKLVLSLIIFIISFFFKNNNELYLSFILLAYIIISYKIYIDGLKKIVKGEIFDENFLMILATLGSFYIAKYPEAFMVMFLFELGEYLQDLAIDNSKKAITDLIDLRCDYAHIKEKDDIVKKKIEYVEVGDILVVKPGEKVPLDGVVVSGSSNVDTSSLTGESVPRTINIKDVVLSGTINLDSVLEICATSVFQDSTASKIINIIENSNESKTNTEKFITKFSRIYTPVIVILAILIAIIPLLIGKDFNLWLYRALEFLVISCPCALVISIPLGFFCGIGRASKEGILVKGSNELEHLSNIKAIVFDKTGTLTKGNFEVTKICNSKKITSNRLLEITAYAEYYSNHPIAKAIIRKYKKKIDKNRIRDFIEIGGKGITCYIDDIRYYLGTSQFLLKHGIKADIHYNEIGTIIYVANDNSYLGHILIADEIKKEAYSLINSLSKLDINKVIMLSGDDARIVEKVGKEIDCTEYYANLLPYEKVDKLKEVREDFFTAFVGDGINDAPVIKLSDIGIAMGGIGSEVAIEASDIVLMRDDLSNIPKAIKISKLTKKIIKHNILFALTFKLIMLILSLFGYTSIWMAVFADVGVTLLSILNALRIMKIKI